MRGSKAGTRWLGLFLCAMAAMLLFAAPASARKTHLFLETFGSAAQPTFQGSRGLAVDQSNGDLLVIDSVPKTVSRYKPNGEPDPFPALGTNAIDAKKGPGAKACAEEPSSCDQTPQNGFTMGGFAGEAEVAVDNSGTVTDGDIYVTSPDPVKNSFANFVDVFAPDGHYLGQLTAAGGSSFEQICGVAVDSGGNVFLAEHGKLTGEPEPKIYKYDPSASPPLNTDNTATFTLPEPVCNLAAGTGSSAGALFAGTFFSSSGNGVLKFNAASGAFEGVIAPSTQAGVVLSVDPLSGHLFKVSNQSLATGAQEFTASGALVSTLVSAGAGIAIDGPAERIYLSSTGTTVGVYDGALATLPDVSTGSYEIKGDTSVRVKGTVNPDGEALEDCHFEYVVAADYEKSANNPYQKGSSAPCEAPNAAEVGSGASPVEVHADLTLLNGETAYHFRLVAKNANAALYPNDKTTVVRGEDQVFKTPSKPGIKELWAQDVITTDATLKATLNPENSATTYRFEYGDQGPCDANPCARAPALPAPEPSLGSDGADHTVGFNLSGLEPATTYHYRLVATNGIGVSESADHRFTTFAVPVPPGGECENDAFRTGPGALLPDCRAYEMVSPLDKGGGDIRVLENSLAQPGVLEQASDSGEKLAYGSIRSFGDAASAPYTSQYIARRVDGAEWQTHGINPPTGRLIVPTIDAFEKEFRAFSPDLCQAWYENFYDPPLAEGALPGNVNVYLRSDRLCGEERYEALAPIVVPDGMLAGSTSFVRVSADGSHALVDMQRTGGDHQLFVATPAGAKLVCVMPDAQPISSLCREGGEGRHAPGTISADGSRVFWSAGDRVYLRYNSEAPESARLHGAASGKGNLIGPATGTGNALAGSELVKNVKTESGGFAVGQEVSDSNGGIPANTTIKACSPDCTAPTELTLSAKVSAGKTKLGDALTGAASATVPGIVTETGAFEAGQEISAPAIPPGTTVLSCSPSCGAGATSLILSAKATKTKTGAALSATSPCTEAATRACTIPVSEAAEEEAGASESSSFWGAAADGSKAIFTVSTGAGEGVSKLYSFEPDGEATSLLAEGVYGVMGISEDAGRVYFASSKAIVGSGQNSEGNEAEAGKPNLYLYEAGEVGGTFEYIATLAGTNDLEKLGFAIMGYRETTARVSPDGAHAAFASVAPLTGYDNNTEASDAACPGEGHAPCREIYLYDAEAQGGEGKLACASCNPSGARPAEGSSMPIFQTPMHGARTLSDDGTRLYFETADALTPRDTNGAVDVYQWEAPGAGTCTESSPTYSAQDEGCIDLISSGQSHLDSRFVEASPTGDDVFIATASGLLPQDPGGVDIYDARVNGGLPIPAGPPPGCEGEACQSPPEAPNDPTPASLSFEGAGNVREEAPLTRKPCAKGKARRKGRCVAVRHHKHAKRHPARGAHPNRGAAR